VYPQYGGYGGGGYGGSGYGYGYGYGGGGSERMIMTSDAKKMSREMSREFFGQHRERSVSAREMNFRRGDLVVVLREEYKR